MITKILVIFATYMALAPISFIIEKLLEWYIIPEPICKFPHVCDSISPVWKIILVRIVLFMLTVILWWYVTITDFMWYYKHFEGKKWLL